MGGKRTKVKDVFAVVQKCIRLRDALMKDAHTMTEDERKEICDLLWDYREELLKKDVN
mgnify:CR=1 FL=1